MDDIVIDISILSANVDLVCMLACLHPPYLNLPNTNN